MLAFLLVIAAALVGRACDTPVYRYAMYNWAPSPYVLYHFAPAAQGQSSGSRAGGDILQPFPEEGSAPLANLVQIPVANDDNAQLAEIPPAVLTARAGWNAPVCDIILGPQGSILHTGEPLPDADIAQLKDSPIRRELSSALAAGTPCVLLLLPGDDVAANQVAAEAVAEVIERGRQGEIEPARLGRDPGRETEATPPIELVSMNIIRGEGDAWLVKMLMAVELDLSEYASQPMVFPIYGRARAMEPYIGEGITADNLAECVSFIIGSCSCQVKDQNPGVDLIVREDWESAALALAQQVGQEEGNEGLLQSADVGLLSKAITAAPAADIDLPSSAAPANGPPKYSDQDTPIPTRVVSEAAPVEPSAASTDLALRWGAAVLLLVVVAAAGTLVVLRRSSP